MEGHISRLPDETIAYIFTRLPDADLRAAAGTCKRFRAITRSRSPGCVVFHFKYRDGHQQTIGRLSAVVDSVRSRSSKLDLVVDCHFAPKLGEPTELPTDLVEFLDDLPAAIPYLRRLSLSLGAGPALYTKLFDSLRQAAPSLRSLLFREWEHTVKQGDAQRLAMAIPSGIFLGQCPQLLQVTLDNVYIAPGATSAFATVTDLTLTYGCGAPAPNMILGHHFPTLRTLNVTSNGTTSATPADFALGALPTLHRLTFQDHETWNPWLTPSLHRHLAGHLVPVVRQYSTSDSWFESYWNDVREALSMRVHEGPFLPQAAVVSDLPRLYRIFCFDYHDETEDDLGGPVYELSFLADRLVYVRIENRFLAGLLRFDCALPLLRRLHIDLNGAFRWELMGMLWPPYHLQVAYSDPYEDSDVERDPTAFDERDQHSIPCLALEELVVFAQKAALSVSSREAAHLGRALGQRKRRVAQRARLVLTGVSFEEPVQKKLLRMVFSEVIQRPFTTQDPDDILWDACK